MSRAKDMVRLARSGEQPGFFGLGKYEADVYFLDIRKRAAILKKKLEKEQTRRQLYRASRAKAGLPTVSLAGYTSAGKTTLFNRLTSETKDTGRGVFTTLSTYTRALEFANGQKILLNDTVGFISKLPAYMIDAFKSTLEELKFASLVLLVMDASDSLDVFERKFVASRDVISEFEVPETKIIYVLNKADITSENEAFDKADKLGLSDRNRLILVSAKTCFNINNLRNMIRESIFANTALLPKKCG
jgi:GTP-binding protein HflX